MLTARKVIASKNAAIRQVRVLSRSISGLNSLCVDFYISFRITKIASIEEGRAKDWNEFDSLSTVSDMNFVFLPLRGNRDGIVTNNAIRFKILFAKKRYKRSSKKSPATLTQSMSTYSLKSVRVPRGGIRNFCMQKSYLGLTYFPELGCAARELSVISLLF